MAADKFPAAGAILWAQEMDLNTDVFRKGAATKPNVDFIRYVDLDIRDRSGRIDGSDSDRLVVSPGQGVSLYLERLIPSGMMVLNDDLRKTIEKSRQLKVHWWSIERGHPIPAGLVLKYDGVPPGHCILTVTREMSVKAFLSLVALVPFQLVGYEVYAAM